MTVVTTYLQDLDDPNNDDLDPTAGGLFPRLLYALVYLNR
jgi:hypothetical protein